MSDTITFSVPGRAPAATSPNSRAHWHQKAADGSEYADWVWAHTTSVMYPGFGSPWQRAHVEVTQRAVRLRDHDNFIASFKPGLDAIVRAGIIVDDKPSVIDLTVRAEKVAKESMEEVLITITRLDGTI